MRLTRREFEAMIRPTLNDTVDSLRRALRAAGVEADDLDAVLLVGGSSRIPIVAQMVSAELNRPVAVDADPKFAVASGAALAAARARAAATPPALPPPPPAAPVVEPAVAAPAFSSVESSAPDGGGSGRRNLLLAGGLVAVAVIAAIVLLTRGGGDDPEDDLAYVEVTDVYVERDAYVVELAAQNFTLDFADLHAHLFWDTTDRATAGENGVPARGQWVETTAAGEFLVADRPEGATGICALVGTVDHDIADVDGDGEPDIESGDCQDLPDPGDEAAEHDGPYVEVTNVTLVEDLGSYTINFRTFNFDADMADLHVHFFWDTTDRETAGENGQPAPGVWLDYAGASPAIDQTFDVANRPADADSICALVGNADHEIADIDGDGAPDPDSGDCYDLPDEAS